jgi:hypothetical protein
MGTMTQQGAFRKDRNALNRAKALEITDGDIINQMAKTHSKPNSAQAYAEAAGALIHTQANMSKETPIHDAFQAILEERKALNSNGKPT